jgi:hypothetical protein
MSNSLQEQLLQLGLVNKSKVQQAKKEKRKQKQDRRPATARSSVAQAVARAEADKAARDRELNRQKEIKQAAKARRALLRQFIEQNRLNAPSADQAYNFVHGSSVKRLYVTGAQREQLVAGKLAIAQSGDRYYLVGLETAAKIRNLSPTTFVFIAQQEAGDKDDPYAGFQVPDDLMW